MALCDQHEAGESSGGILRQAVTKDVRWHDLRHPDTVRQPVEQAIEGGQILEPLARASEPVEHQVRAEAHCRLWRRRAVRGCGMDVQPVGFESAKPAGPVRRSGCVHPNLLPSAQGGESSLARFHEVLRARKRGLADVCSRPIPIGRARSRSSCLLLLLRSLLLRALLLSALLLGHGPITSSICLEWMWRILRTPPGRSRRPRSMRPTTRRHCAPECAVTPRRRSDAACVP